MRLHASKQSFTLGLAVLTELKSVTDIRADRTLTALANALRGTKRMNEHQHGTYTDILILLVAAIRLTPNRSYT